MLLIDLYAVHLSLHDNTSVGKVPKFGKVGTLSNFYVGAQTIQGGVLLFEFHSTCANYSREQTVQGGILFKEIRYLNLVLLGKPTSRVYDGKI